MNQPSGIRSEDGLHAITLGLYCAGNLGDDLLMFAVADALEARGARVTLAVRSTADAAGLTSRPIVPAPGISRRMVGDLSAYWRALRGADLLVLGGGGLFQDTHYAHTVAVYTLPLALAVARGRNAAIWGVGVGPVRRGWNRALTRACFRLADLVTLRDEDSIVALGDASAPRPPIVEDAVWGLELPEVDTVERRAPRIGLVLREWPGLPERALAARVAEVARAAGAAVSLIPFEYSAANPRDWTLAERVRDWIAEEGVKAELSLPRAYPETRATLEALRGCDVVLSMRFHGVILSMRAGVPICAIDCAPKIRELLAGGGLGDRLVAVADAGSERVGVLLREALGDPASARRAQEGAAQRRLAGTMVNVPTSEALAGLRPPRLARRLRAAGVAVIAILVVGFFTAKLVGGRILGGRSR